MAGLLRRGGLLLAKLLVIPINGLLISLTWNWFIVPVLGAPTVNFVEGIGFSIFWSLFYRRPPTLDQPDSDDFDWLEALDPIIGPPIMIFICAWIWHAVFMP
jgi:hypothetical protein